MYLCEYENLHHYIRNMNKVLKYCTSCIRTSGQLGITIWVKCVLEDKSFTSKNIVIMKFDIMHADIKMYR